MARHSRLGVHAHEAEAPGAPTEAPSSCFVHVHVHIANGSHQNSAQSRLCMVREGEGGR